MEYTFCANENLTVSFGVAQKTKGEQFGKLCKRADDALYQAKEGGRNKVCLSESVVLDN